MYVYSTIKCIHMLVHHNKWAIIPSVYIACSTFFDENVFKLCYEHFQLSLLFQEIAN